MKHIKTYKEFGGVEEDAVTGQDSKVTIDNIYIAKLDRELKGAEILGVIKSSETEDEFKDYFYDNYGNGVFTTAELSKLVTFYNGYAEEENAKDAEEEEAGEKGGGAEDPGEDDELDI